MMKWNLRSEKEPKPGEDSYILVIGRCGKPHVAYWRHGEWFHTECCNGSGHFMGASIKFDRWLSFHRPERLNPEEQCKHEWGSEEYENSSEAHYVCNKCDTVMR